MSLINDIKSFFYRKDLNHELKKLKSFQRHMINLNEAKSIGIVFNATKTEDVMTVTQFADSLKNLQKRVLMLGYQDYKVKEQNDHRLFNKNDINWYGKPTTQQIVDFQEEGIDILISAHIDECRPLEYIVATSKAKFRVGAYSKTNTSHLELMINLQKKPELNYLLQQITHFLKVINKNNAQ